MARSQTRRGRKQTQARDPLAVQNGSLIRKTGMKAVTTSTSAPALAENGQQPTVRHPRGEQADYLAEVVKEISKATRAAARQVRNLAPPTRTQPERAASKRASPKPAANAVSANAASTAAAVVEEISPDGAEDETTRAPDQTTLAVEITALQHEQARLLASNRRLSSANQHLVAKNARLTTRTSTLEAMIPGLNRVAAMLEGQAEYMRAETEQIKTTIGAVWDFVATFENPREAELEVVLDFLASGKEMGWTRPASWKATFKEAKEWKGRVMETGWMRDGMGRWREV